MLSVVIAGLDPAIHDESQWATAVRFSALRFIMDARVKPAHDAEYPARTNLYRPHGEIRPKLSRPQQKWQAPTRGPPFRCQIDCSRSVAIAHLADALAEPVDPAGPRAGRPAVTHDDLGARLAGDVGA